MTKAANQITRPVLWEKSVEIPLIDTNDRILLVYGNHRPADLDVMHAFLTVDELAFANRLQVIGQRNTWISCRITLRLMIGTFLHLKPIAIEFKKNRFGRLSLADSKLFFNISHTESSFLLGFSFNGKIGVDIEKFTGVGDLNSLIEYAFTDQETEYCQNGKFQDRFLEIWTLKEAFLKAAGVGLVDNLKAVNVYGSINNEIGRRNFNSYTFKCPNGETASIVFKDNKPVKHFWLS